MPEHESRPQTQREQMMLLDPLPKVIVRMSLPSIISFLITSIYNLADTFFVSGLGESATAAVSVNASLDQIIYDGGVYAGHGLWRYPQLFPGPHFYF